MAASTAETGSASLFGLAALMSSGVGVAMVFGVGVAVLVRRGWRPAAFSTVPLAGAYGVWWLSQRPETSQNPNHLGPVDFAARHARLRPQRRRRHLQSHRLLPLRRLAGRPRSWWSVSCWRSATRSRTSPELRRRYAIVLGVFAAGFAFLVSSASGRAALGPAFATASRYLYLGLVFLLPLFGVALTAIARRSTVAGVVVGLLFLSVIPGNITRFDPSGIINSQYFAAQRRTLFSGPSSPFADQVPSWARIDPLSARDATIGWLEATDRTGRLPSVPPLTDQQADQLELRLTVQQGGPGTVPDAGSCRPVTEPEVITEPVGQTFHVGGSTVSFTMTGSRGTQASIQYQPAFGTEFSIELPDREVTLVPAKVVGLSGPTVLCP